MKINLSMVKFIYFLFFILLLSSIYKVRAASISEGKPFVWQNQVLILDKLEPTSVSALDAENREVSINLSDFEKEATSVTNFLDENNIKPEEIIFYDGRMGIVENVDDNFVVIKEPIGEGQKTYSSVTFVKNLIEKKIQLLNVSSTPGVDKKTPGVEIESFGNLTASAEADSSRAEADSSRAEADKVKQLSIIEGDTETVYNSNWAWGPSSVLAAQASLQHLAKGASEGALEALRKLDFDNPELAKFFDAETIQILKDAYFANSSNQVTALVALNTLAVDEVSRKRAQDLVAWANNPSRLNVIFEDPVLDRRAAALISKKGTITIIRPNGESWTTKLLVVDVAATRHSYEMSGLLPKNEVGVGDKFIVDIVNPNFARTLGWEFDTFGNPYKASSDEGKTIRIAVEKLPTILVFSPVEGVRYFFYNLWFGVRRIYYSLF